MPTDWTGRGKPWRSVYWDESDGDKDRLTQQKGFDEQPFWAPRWDTTGADIWGQGPGHDALPDLRELQMQAKRKGEATDMHIWPEIVTSSKVKLKRQPKSVVSAAEVDVGKLVTVPYEVPYEAIESIREDIERDQAGDRRDPPMPTCSWRSPTCGHPAPQHRRDRRPQRREADAARAGHRAGQQRKAGSRDRAHVRDHAAGRLLPPPPDALAQSPDLKIEFVSILTQMQRMVGLGQIERTTASSALRPRCGLMRSTSSTSTRRLTNMRHAPAHRPS
jgi:hypothetical protein